MINCVLIFSTTSSSLMPPICNSLTPVNNSSNLTHRWLHFHTPLVLMRCDLFKYGSSPPYFVQPFHQRVMSLTQPFSSKIPTPLHYPFILWTHLDCSSSVSAYSSWTLPLPVSIFHFQPLFFHKPYNIIVLPLLNPQTQFNSRSNFKHRKRWDGYWEQSRKGLSS